MKSPHEVKNKLNSKRVKPRRVIGVKGNEVGASFGCCSLGVDLKQKGEGCKCLNAFGGGRPEAPGAFL